MAEGDGGRGIRRIACIVQYDGTNFSGWQYQKNGRTVQGVIEEAIQILTRETPRVSASGRTDSGVHALGQVIHFDLESQINLQKICIGLNGILPADVSVKNAYHVPISFHSRYSAVEREYRYYIYNYPQRSPFMRYRAMWVHDPVDVEYMRDVVKHLVGEYDFSSFCKKREAADKNTVRRISNIEINKKKEYIEMVFVGKSFLHHMVRIIVGTVMEMHKNRDNPADIIRTLGRKDRDFSGITAPPYGLYLCRIAFDPPLTDGEPAFPC